MGVTEKKEEARSWDEKSETQNEEKSILLEKMSKKKCEEEEYTDENKERLRKNSQIFNFFDKIYNCKSQGFLFFF